jgi:hypothetical protein
MENPLNFIKNNFLLKASKHIKITKPMEEMWGKLQKMYVWGT